MQAHTPLLGTTVWNVLGMQCQASATVLGALSAGSKATSWLVCKFTEGCFSLCFTWGHPSWEVYFGTVSYMTSADVLNALGLAFEQMPQSVISIIINNSEPLI